MAIIIKILGAAVVVLGIVFTLKPKAVKKYISFWKEKKHIKLGGLLAGIFGIIFLIAAPQCRLPWVINVFGIWSIIKGVLLYALSQKKINTYLGWWLNKPNAAMSGLGLAAIAFGALLMYSA
jgi:hypothetical protein